MNSLVLMIGSVIIFIIAYATYGAWLAKKWGVDTTRRTPAHEINDGVDYVPTSPSILLGHHFASIAGAGPINGPIQAAIFGWVPVYLWIMIGCIFFGAPHDMGSLFVSIRHKGKSLGEVIGDTMGDTGRKLFSLFAWLTLLLVVAAFTNIVATTFAATPEAATSSVLFMIIAVVFGYAVYRKGVSIKIGTVVGVTLLFASIWFGTKYPLQLSVNTWIIILSIYIFVASTAPVWILLQPRDYLNSYLLYAMMAAAILGIIVYRPEIKLAPVTSFEINGQFLFPMLFVTVACGAISGFHSLVGSGTSSKQLDSEKDVRPIGFGSMLIEGVLAVAAMITAAYLTQGEFLDKLSTIGPTNVFAEGVATFMAKFGIPFETGKNFIVLAVSAFALTSLDTATRLARFIFQEYFEDPTKEKQSPLTNMYVSTTITVVLGAILAVGGYSVIWPIFGSANQLLAALALMTVALWLKKQKRAYNMLTIPMIFMLIVTLCALVLLAQSNIASGNYILVGFAVALFILAIVLAVQGYKILFKEDSSKLTEQAN